MTVRDLLDRLIPPPIGRRRDLQAIDDRVGKFRGWTWNRLNGKALIYADEVPLLADALDVRISDLYADTPAGQREIAERVEGIDREIVTLLAGCTDAQKRAVLQTIRIMLEFPREEGAHAEETPTDEETIP